MAAVGGVGFWKDCKDLDRAIMHGAGFWNASPSVAPGRRGIAFSSATTSTFNGHFW